MFLKGEIKLEEDEIVNELPTEVPTEETEEVSEEVPEENLEENPLEPSETLQTETIVANDGVTVTDYEVMISELVYIRYALYFLIIVILATRFVRGRN